jgi:hypothetical protein
MRPDPITGSITRLERDTPLYTHQLATVVHGDRQREIERRLRYGPRSIDRRPRNSVRRRVGLELIRIGSTLAPDGPLQLAARR